MNEYRIVFENVADCDKAIKALEAAGITGFSVHYCEYTEVEDD